VQRKISLFHLERVFIATEIMSNSKNSKRKRKRDNKKGNATAAVAPGGVTVAHDAAPDKTKLETSIHGGPITTTEHGPRNDHHNNNKKPVCPPSDGALTTTTTIPHCPEGRLFLTAEDGAPYRKLLRDHYQGFVLLAAADVPAAATKNTTVGGSTFHDHAKRALERLRDARHYQYDMVLAGGKNLSRTFVQRTLVGNPGITYKYLGLRLFAHAWSGPATPPAFSAIHDMNQSMIRFTKEQQQRQKQQQQGRVSKDPNNGSRSSCEYNLTLINYMEPSCDLPLKDEEHYGMGKTSVSWHADSGVQDYSCIGVYHTLPTQRASKWDWKLALRPNPDTDDRATTATSNTSGNPVPPVVIPTRSGDLYFLLGAFNHTHQHMVLAGSEAHRISSTHRVANVEHDTYEYIRARVSAALTACKAQLREKKGRGDGWDVEVLLEGQAVLTEVEFEWIAQYWVQGAQHNVQHVWWQVPMQNLEQAWNALEKITFKVNMGAIQQSETEKTNNKNNTQNIALLEGLRKAFLVRKELRERWDERRANKQYKRRISRPYQPVERPIFEQSTKRLPKDLSAAIQTLTDLLQQSGGAVMDVGKKRFGQHLNVQRAKKNENEKRR
jgi:mRNA N6-methyladenine demethylase